MKKLKNAMGRLLQKTVEVPINPPATPKIQGQPVSVYNSPTGTKRKGTAARNVGRIGTLQQAMTKLERRGLKDSEAYENLKIELTRRVLHFEQDKGREDN